MLSDPTPLFSLAPLLVILIFVFGLIAGSFTNAVVYRVPNKESLNTRSHCVHCDHMITWYQNIPVLSYMFLGGKCANCRGRISARYPIVELAVGFLFLGVAAVVWHLIHAQLLDTGVIASADVGNDVGLGAMAALIAGYLLTATGLSALFIIDIERKLLPRQIIFWTTGLLAAALVAAVALSGGLWLSQLIEAAVCAVALFAFYFTLWFVYPKGMGFGDVRLAALIGLAGGFFGWEVVVVATMSAFVLAGIYGVSLMVLQKGANVKTAIPFGPWMIIGLLVGMIFGHNVIDIYMSISGLR